MKRIFPLLLILLTVSCSKEPAPVDEFADCKELEMIPEAHAIANLDSIGLFEGDIIIDQNKSVALTDHIWKDAVIPFYIRDKFPAITMQAIREGVKQLNDQTYLKLVEYPSRDALFKDLGMQADHVYVIINPFANSSYVGRKGGAQYITFSFIDEPFISAHEFLHSAGMMHEMTRSDRDEFVVVDYKNMPEYYHRQYTKWPDRDPLFAGIDYTEEYDTTSVMGYNSFKNQIDETKPTLYWKADGSTWEQAKKLSEGDILGVNELYKCEYYNRINN